jgi:hypothetical protein
MNLNLSSPPTPSPNPASQVIIPKLFDAIRKQVLASKYQQ